MVNIGLHTLLWHWLPNNIFLLSTSIVECVSTYIQGSIVGSSTQYLFVGEMLNITCMFSSPQINWNWNNSVFMRGVATHTVVDRKYYTKISPQMLQMVIPNVTMDDSMYYFCHHGSNLPDSIDYVGVKVAHPPKSPIVDVWCDDSENMTFQWCTDSTELGYPTNWTLKWKYINWTDEDFQECPELRRSINLQGNVTCTSCVWLDGDENLNKKLNLFTTYDVRLLANNRFIENRSLPRPVLNFSFLPYYKVKPGVTHNFAVVAVNETCLLISWCYPQWLDPSWINLQFKIVYWSELNDTEQELMVESTSQKCMEHTLTELEPNTLHYFEITSCQLNVCSHWSQAVKTFVKTHEAAPSAAPDVLAGSFQWINKSFVAVFAKSLHPRLVRGNITMHIIDVYNDQHRSLTSVNCTERRVHRCLLSPPASSRYYWLNIRAFTAVGGSPSRLLHLPAASHLLKRPQPPDITKKFNDTKILFDWTFNGEIDNYTLIICIVSQDQTCKEILEVAEITRKNNLFTFENTKGRQNIVYNVASNSKSGSSGLADGPWMCIFDCPPVPDITTAIWIIVAFVVLLIIVIVVIISLRVRNKIKKHVSIVPPEPTEKKTLTVNYNGNNVSYSTLPATNGTSGLHEPEVKPTLNGCTVGTSGLHEPEVKPSLNGSTVGTSELHEPEVIEPLLNISTVSAESVTDQKDANVQQSSASTVASTVASYSQVRSDLHETSTDIYIPPDGSQLMEVNKYSEDNGPADSTGVSTSSSYDAAEMHYLLSDQFDGPPQPIDISAINNTSDVNDEEQ